MFTSQSQDRGLHDTELQRAKILVAVCSARHNSTLRSACRDTWASTGHEDVTVRFFVGGGPSTDEPDVIGLLVSDDPHEGLAKVMVMFREILKSGAYDWIFKCDDGAYVDLQRLPELVKEGVDIIGDMHIWERGTLDGRAGYLIAREMLVKLVTHGRVGAIGNDDAVIGKEMLRLGGAVMASDRLRSTAKPYPRFNNTQISAFCGNVRNMLATHIVRLNRSIKEWQVEQESWKDTLLVYENGIFARKNSYCLGTIGEDERGKILCWFDWSPERLFEQPEGSVVDFLVRGMHWQEPKGVDAIDILKAMMNEQKEVELTRYGPPHDGGYLLPDDVSYDRIITIGVSNDIGFEADYARTHPATHFVLFDHTVNGLPEELPNSEFHKIGVGHGESCLPLPQLLAGRWIEGEAILLKIDCEGGEWNCDVEKFDCASIHTLVLEIHDLLKPNGAERRAEILDFISSHFVLIHIHPNNYSRSGSLRGMIFSDCLELTLVHRDRINDLLPRTRKVANFDNAPHLSPAVLAFSPTKTVTPTGKMITRTVFSLSTSPTRIKTIAPTIDSLLEQSHPPDCIYVNCPWIFHRTSESFAEEDLVALERLAPGVVVVNRCDDVGPISKLLPTLALEEHPETLIVILDDDNRYPNELLERMMQACQEFPDTVHANRIWLFDGELNIAEGWGGVGIRRGLVDRLLFQDFVHHAIQHHDCYRSDDLVMSYFFRLCNIPVKRCPRPLSSEILQSINDDTHALFKQDQLDHAQRYRRSLAALEEQ
jgi:hypothetical protein